MDWIDLAWPWYYKELQTQSTNALENMKYPKVQKSVAVLCYAISFHLSICRYLSLFTHLNRVSTDLEKSGNFAGSRGKFYILAVVFSSCIMNVFNQNNVITVVVFEIYHRIISNVVMDVGHSGKNSGCGRGKVVEFFSFKIG